MAEYKAPFVLKIKFYLPDQTNAKKNAAHIRYIGTRPGVDRGGELEEQKILLTETLRVPDSAAHHVKYAHERPRSHGLFGAGEEEINLAGIQNELLAHKGIAWRMVVSLHGDDAKRLQMEELPAWKEALKQQMPEVAAHMGIAESNFRWVAAYHPEEGHPHAHIVFWESKPKRRMGKVTPYVKNQLRKSFIKKIYAPDRERYAAEKTALRNEMRELGLSTLREQVKFMRSYREQAEHVEYLSHLAGNEGGEGLTPRLTDEQSDYLAERLKDISKMLPGKGRLMLKFMPEDVKKAVRELAEWLYSQSQFNSARSEYERAAEILTRPYTFKEEDLRASVQNARNDMIDRLSQVVLKAASESGKTNQFAINPDHAKEILEKMEFACRTVKDDSFRERVAAAILNLCQQVGIKLEEYSQIVKELRLHELEPEEVKAVFEQPDAQEAVKLPKVLLYLLKGAFEEEQAWEIANRIGFKQEDFDQVQVYNKSWLDDKKLGNFLGIKHEEELLVGKMAKVLYSCGASREEVERLLVNWHTRSGASVPLEVLKNVVRHMEKVIKEEFLDWGRTPIIGKIDFKKMCEAIGIEVPYPWRTGKERNALVSGHSKSITQSLFKFVSKAFKRQSKKSTAEYNRLQKQIAGRIKAEAERQEKERDRKQKGR